MSVYRRGTATKRVLAKTLVRGDLVLIVPWHEGKFDVAQHKTGAMVARVIHVESVLRAEPRRRSRTYLVHTHLGMVEMAPVAKIMKVVPRA